MVLISILLDLIALGGYFLVTASTTQPVFWLLTIVESIIVVILIGFFFSYRGKRRSRFYDPDIGARPYTIRFSIIAVSSDFCFPLFTRYYLFSRSCYTVISFRLVPIPAMTNKTIQIITFAGIIMF